MRLSSPATRRLRALRSRLNASWIYAKVRQPATAWRERRMGVETGVPVSVPDLGLTSPESGSYIASGWRALRRILPVESVNGNDAFLDLGSGKGRVLIEAAARYRFRRIIGVELAEELNSVARANLDRLGLNHVEVVAADAPSYEIPDDVTVIYLYNPVWGESFGHVVENIVASLDRSPRRMRVIYRSPVEEARLLATRRFELVRSWRGVRFWSSTGSTRLYQTAKT